MIRVLPSYQANAVFKLPSRRKHVPSCVCARARVKCWTTGFQVKNRLKKRATKANAMSKDGSLVCVFWLKVWLYKDEKKKGLWNLMYQKGQGKRSANVDHVKVAKRCQMSSSDAKKVPRTFSDRVSVPMLFNNSCCLLVRSKLNFLLRLSSSSKTRKTWMQSINVERLQHWFATEHSQMWTIRTSSSHWTRKVKSFQI